jgi:hypothetical protein
LFLRAFYYSIIHSHRRETPNLIGFTPNILFQIPQWNTQLEEFPLIVPAAWTVQLWWSWKRQLCQ